MSFDWEISEKEWNDSAFEVGNDGTLLIEERQTYPHPITPEGEDTPKLEQKRKGLSNSFLGYLKRGSAVEKKVMDTRQRDYQVIDGISMEFFNQGDVSKMSCENANSYLNQVELDDILLKRKYSYLGIWRKYYFRLRGNSILYYANATSLTPLRRYEITSSSVVVEDNHHNHPFCFSFASNKGQPRHYFEAANQAQRDQWMRCITVVIMLLKRLSSFSATKTIVSIDMDIHLGDILGKGSYGMVRLGQMKNTGEMVAVKVINRQKLDSAILKRELYVIDRIMQMSNPDIVGIRRVYEDTYLVYIVMEYLGGGDVMDRIGKEGHLSEKEAKSVVYHTSQALDCLHTHHIYHLDVKPSNIIYESFDRSSRMKLADFGCSVLYDDLNKDTTEIVGTEGFIAPEILLDCQYSDKSDVYSLGVTMYMMLMGYMPSSRNPVITWFNHEDWQYFSEEAFSLIQQMLQTDPERRIGIKEVLLSDWFKSL